MKLSLKFSLAALAFTVFCASAQAAIVEFDLQGKGGFGLLSTNENGTISGTPGSGGEVGSGISFNDTTFVLTLNVGWGTANGFSNLSGPVTASHIHGLTAGSGVTAFSQNASVIYPVDSLSGFNTSASAGGFSGTVTFTSGQVADLMAGRFYFNVHTAANGGGELRGNLVPVPEPGSAGLLALGALGLGLSRRRRTLVAS